MTDLAEVAAAGGVRDTRLLRAMRKVSRAGFVPRDQADLAEWDVPVPIGHGQTTSQPSLIAAMIEALELDGTETVLEIGTGHGYQTALLAALARDVWSIESVPELAAAARENLAAAGVANAQVITGDGSQGLAEHAPFDAIVVSAASPQIPPPLLEQLASGGRLVQPVGHGGEEEVMLFTKDRAGISSARSLTQARFVPLTGEHGVGARKSKSRGA